MKLDSVKPPLPHNNAGLVLLVATRGCFPQIDLLGGDTLCTSNTQLRKRPPANSCCSTTSVCFPGKCQESESVFFSLQYSVSPPGFESAWKRRPPATPPPAHPSSSAAVCVCKQQADKKRLKDLNVFVSRSPSSICMKLCSCVSRSKMIV